MDANENCTTLVQSVAREIFKRRHGKASNWEGLPPFVRKNYKEDAQAAIQAIRNVMLNPTDEMIDAANRSVPSTTSGMIIAAIKASELNADIKE